MHIHNPAEKITDAAAALRFLMEGNQRYLTHQPSPKDTYAQDREVLAGGQKPFAVVLCCSDSRVAPEIFFDQRLGDIFVIRNAGNIVDQTTLGSLEYAVEHLGTPLVVVCGHSQCGAVTAACQGGHLPANIQSIADHIQPACEQGGSVDDVIRRHVQGMMEAVRADAIVQAFGTAVCGAYYDIHSGEVCWF